MLRTSTRSVLPAVRAASRSTVGRRTYHVSNEVGQNFPFNYDGASRTRFTVIFWGAMATSGIVIPVFAYWLQTAKYKGTL
ncbi:hypothetical protein JCM10213_007364 [Rhodosporidiobolus nylandii]